MEYANFQNFAKNELLQKQYSFGEVGTGINKIQCPKSIVIDEEMSHIYLTEGMIAPRILVFTFTGYLITSFKHKKMRYPWGIAKNKDNIYVTDTHADAVFLFKQDERICKVMKIGKNYGSGINQFSYPKSIAVCKKGDVYIADEYNHRIQVIDCNLNYIRTISDPVDKLYRPIELKLTSDKVYVLCRLDRFKLHVFSHTGERLPCRGIEDTRNGVRRCGFFCLDRSNNVIISDKESINIYNTTGEGRHLQLPSSNEMMGQMLIQPQGITVSNDSRIFVVSLGSKHGIHILF